MTNPINNRRDSTFPKILGVGNRSRSGLCARPASVGAAVGLARTRGTTLPGRPVRMHHFQVGHDRPHMNASAPIYPVGLVVAGRRCLVVGGGHVAGRKTRSLLACRAAVTMVAPEAHEALAMLASDGSIASIDDAPLDVQLRPYRAGEVAGYRLVVTATGVPEVDRAVAEEAERAGVWVNSADDAANCTFMLPAVHRSGPVTISVSTSGASPALASWLRGRIADLVEPGLGDLAVLLEEARRFVHEDGGSTESVDWARLLDGPLPGLVASGQIQEARRYMRAALVPDEESGMHPSAGDSQA